jgi:hypothetical protein
MQLPEKKKRKNISVLYSGKSLKHSKSMQIKIFS